MNSTTPPVSHVKNRIFESVFFLPTRLFLLSRFLVVFCFHFFVLPSNLPRLEFQHCSVCVDYSRSFFLVLFLSFFLLCSFFPPAFFLLLFFSVIGFSCSVFFFFSLLLIFSPFFFLFLDLFSFRSFVFLFSLSWAETFVLASSQVSVPASRAPSPPHPGLKDQHRGRYG